MATCKVNNSVIKERCFETAIEIDGNAIINDNMIKFSSDENLMKFVSEIDSMFKIDDIESIIDYDRESNIAIIEDTSEIEDMYSFEEKPKDDSEYEMFNMNSMAQEYKPGDMDVEYMVKVKKSMSSELNKISNELNKIYTELKNPELTDIERNELRKKSAYYGNMREYLKKNIDEFGYDFESIKKLLDSTRKQFDYILSNFNSIKESNMVEILEGLFNTMVFFVDELGNRKYAKIDENENIVSLNEENKIILRRYRNSIKAMKLEFDRKMEEKQIQYIQDNPIFGNADEKMRKILDNPNSEEFKRMFGGAEINDINFLEKLGLNIDTSSTYDGVLGQVLITEFDRIAQDNNNNIFEKKKKFLELSKELKKIGINLEDSKDTDVLMEKDEHGENTGNIISMYTPKFRSRVSEFHEKTKSRDAVEKNNALKIMKNEFNSLNIFKTSFFSKDYDSMTPFEKQFYDCVKDIYSKQYGSDDKFNEMIRESQSNDSEKYERGIKMMVGEEEYKRLLDLFMISVLEYYAKNINEIKQTKHINPLEIIKCFDNYKNGRTGNIKIGGKAANFSKLTFIPNARHKEYFNKTFQNSFLGSDEKSKKMYELYNFINDNYRDFNLLYTGHSSLAATKLEIEYLDEISDSIHGIFNAGDTTESLRNIKKNALLALQSNFFSENYITGDLSKIALNYRDKSKEKKRNYMSAYEIKSESEMMEIAKGTNLNRNDYDSLDEFKEAVARKKSLEGYNDNFYVTTMKMMDLYAAQKTRNEVYPIAKMIERQYNTYKNMSGNQRANANERMSYYIHKAIQKINLESGQELKDKKLENIEFLKNIISKFDEFPILRKIFNKNILRKMDDDEKELYDTIQKAKSEIDSKNPVKFTLDGIKYERDENGKMKKIIGNVSVKILNENKFKEKLTEYYNRKLTEIGSQSTIQNVVDLIRTLLLYKMLAGISTSGMFNRIEGHLANSEMDATGMYWTPGNLNYVEKYFFGTWMQRYINKEGEHAFVDKDKNWVKRMDILRYLANRTNMFQDMKNQFDKTIEGAQQGVFRHNFDLWQFSVSNPEFKNQMSIVLARLMDVEIKDRNGKTYNIFDRETGEFTCFDIINGELVLKEEFDTDENRHWIDFRTIMEIEDENTNTKKKILTPSFRFYEQNKNIIKSVHGDYRTNSALMFNNNLVLSHMMMLKRWYPQKVMRGWSAGGSYDKNGKFIESRDIIMNKGMQSGMWYDMMMKSKSMFLLPFVLSTTKVQKGPGKTGVLLGTLASSIVNLAICGKMAKQRLGANTESIKHNVSMFEEAVEMTKATLYEMLIFCPRVLFKKSYDVRTKSFTGDTFVEEYGEITLGNFRAAARQLATYGYLILLGFAAKLALWDPDDGDEDLRRKTYNWFSNNYSNIQQALLDTLFMAESIEDKGEVSDIPIMRNYNDFKKFIKYANEMNGEKTWQYGKKVFMPIRFSFNPFTSDYEYNKDTPMNRLVKNIKTDREWGTGQDVKYMKQDMKEQYLKMWKRKNLPPEMEEEFASKTNKAGYESIYDVPEEDIKDWISDSRMIPNKTRKEYKGKKNVEMKEIMEKIYEDSEYLQNKTIKWLLGGYDNTVVGYLGIQTGAEPGEDEE